jgi:hypothetical protein
MNNQGNKAANAMQLIMELEGRVRGLIEERDQAIHKYWGALLGTTGRSVVFWWGYGIGLVSVFVVGLVVKWVMGK